MKFIFLRLISFVLTFSFIGGVAAAPIRIMPMGDSITNGSGGTAELGGYRGALYTLLTNAGHDVDFIGTATTNSALMVDMNHEGHGGWRIDQLDTIVTDWPTNGLDPEIVLLHIGTNDFGQGIDTVNAINRLDALITKMASLRPNAHIIVTNIMERGEPQNAAIQTQFNPFVQGVVDNQITNGTSASFLDMRSFVPLSDMPDNLHPNQVGYDKMAAAWFTAIEGVLEPADDVPPAILSAKAGVDVDKVILSFNRTLDQTSAETSSNYTMSGGINVLSASLGANQRVVTLHTNPQTFGTNYTVTVNNIIDQVTPTPNMIAPNSTVTFLRETPRGYWNNVPESDCYTLLYSLDIPTAPNYQNVSPPYAIDRHNLVGSYDRVAYYLELQSPGGDLQYVWASMDSFSSEPGKLGVPTIASGAIFQGGLGNLNVISNVAGLSTGEGFIGNIEFWPRNYSTDNALGVAGASGTTYDFGDTLSATGNYGSMQIHNTTEAETVFGFNAWGGVAGSAGLGIGNNPAPVNNGVDWTFAENGGGYTIKRLQVLVKTDSDLIPPALETASASFGGTSITLRFSEPISRESLAGAVFALDSGVTVLGVTPGRDPREVNLLTTFQPNATPLTLTVSGVRDTSPNANLMAANSVVSVAVAALPAEIITNTGASANGYELVYSLDIPASGNYNAGNPYFVDESDLGGGFSRIAYYLELQKSGGAVEYVWTAMDAFTTEKKMIGIPTAASGAVFQQSVSNLDVISNKAGVINGTGISGGNIEFWPTNYSAPNAIGVPGASETTYDFGDTRTITGTHGSMQVHNSAATQTLFAMNNWGADGQPIALGIGNRPTDAPDWTFANNSATYTRKILHVMVLPTPAAPIPAEVLANVPESANYELVYSLNIPATGNLTGGAGFTPYSVDKSGESQSFSRVAYYMELQKTGDVSPTFVWVSMDAFTTERSKIGVPNLASGAVFQQFVSNMNVVSNSGAVTTGTGLSGNLEFWPTNYNGTNSLPVPGASTTAFDFGDNRTAGDYGSMQVHNYGAGQTLFAINRWGATNNTANKLCVGIGNNPSPVNNGIDWTFAENAAVYDLKRKLHVLVLPGVPTLGGPAVVSASGSTALNKLIVKFDKQLADSSAHVSNFAINGGLTVIGARLLPGNRSIALTTSPQTPGTTYIVSVSGVRDRTPNGALIQSGANASFVAYSAPAIFGNVSEIAGYELINQLNVPVTTPQWNMNPVSYTYDESVYGERLFDRVAYFMELDGNWVYASFDPHTNQISKIGVPSQLVTATAIQRIVTNMNVASNVPGIVTGNGIATGNIEFWGGNYTRENALGIPGADAGVFDFGDTMTVGGHGCMQVHNYGASQTLFAYNNWGSNAGGTSDLGIGNNNSGTGEADWTFGNSASSYTTRNLYILARSGGSANGLAPEIITHPCDRMATIGGSVTFAATPLGAGPFTYQWRKNGVAISGATSAWLELGSLSAADVGTYDVVITGANLASTISKGGELSLDGTNAAPTFSGYRFAVQKDGTAVIPLSAILAKANDVDNNMLSVTSVADPSVMQGIVSLGVNEITYSAPAGVTGADEFALVISDGQGGSVSGVVAVTISNLNVSPQATPALGILTPSGDVETIFAGIPLALYKVERSPDLINWTPIIERRAGDDGIVVYTDTTPLPERGYYRIVAAPEAP